MWSPPDEEDDDKQATSSAGGVDLLRRSERLCSLAYDLARFGGNELLDAVCILDECGRLSDEKGRLALQTMRSEAKLKECHYDLHQHRLRIGQLHDELTATKAESAEWRRKCEYYERSYESLRRIVSLAADTLGGEEAPPLAVDHFAAPAAAGGHPTTNRRHLPAAAEPRRTSSITPADH